MAAENATRDADSSHGLRMRFQRRSQDLLNGPLKTKRKDELLHGETNAQAADERIFTCMAPIPRCQSHWR